MRKFTFFAAIAMFCGVGAMAQTTHDIGMSSIDNIFNGQLIYPNLPIQPQYSITNYGSSTVSQSDADSIIRVFDVVQGGVKGTVRRGTNLPNGGLGAGQTANGYTALDALDFGSYGLSGGNVDICGRTLFYKGSNNGQDANPNNDETCVTVSYQTSNFTYDLAPNNLVMSAPAYPANAYLPIPTFPSEMSFDLENTSNSNPAGVPGYLPLQIDFTVDNGTPIPLTGTPGQPMSTPGTVALTFQWPTGASLPMTQGPFDMCLTINSADDTDASNDEYCVTYNMGNPIGIEEQEFEVFGEFFYDGRELKAVFNEVANGPATLVIFDMSGKQVQSHNMNVDHSKEHSFDVTTLSTGVYIANVTVNGQVLPYRFSVR